MANDITGKTWVLDTVVGRVSASPVYISGILVTFKAASAGTLVLSEVDGNGNSGKRIMTAVSSGATTAAVNSFQKYYPIGGSWDGFFKTTVTDIAAIEVITGNAK